MSDHLGLFICPWAVSAFALGCQADITHCRSEACTDLLVLYSEPHLMACMRSEAAPPTLLTNILDWDPSSSLCSPRARGVEWETLLREVPQETPNYLWTPPALPSP